MRESEKKATDDTQTTIRRGRKKISEEAARACSPVYLTVNVIGKPLSAGHS